MRYEKVSKLTMEEAIWRIVETTSILTEQTKPQQIKGEQPGISMRDHFILTAKVFKKVADKFDALSVTPIQIGNSCYSFTEFLVRYLNGEFIDEAVIESLNLETEE